MLERLARDEHSSLKGTFVNYGIKSIITLATGWKHHYIMKKLELEKGVSLFCLKVSLTRRLQELQYR